MPTLGPRSISILLSLVLLGALLGLTSVAEARTENATYVKVLGDTGSIKTLQAETLIDAPVNTVWAELTDYGNLKNILPGYERSTVLQSGGDGKIVDIGLKANPLTPAFRYQVKIREDRRSNTIHIQRISGDFNAIQANYRMIPTDNGTRTRLVYYLQIDLGKKLPTLGATQMLKGNTEKGMTAMRQACNQSYQRSLAASAGR